MGNYLEAINNGNTDLDAIIKTLGQTVNIVYSNSESTAAILADLKNQKMVLGSIATKVDGIGSTVLNLDDRMSQIELSEEITTNQNENISTAIKRRLFEIIGGDEYEKQKYYRLFACRLYSDARKNSGMGSKVSRTRKRDYQRVLDYIEAWEPRNGCANLKFEADIKAKARRKAKKRGYDC